MNIMYLRYAVEVEKTHSINKAAENLFMGQPNLSRAIKELEEQAGITIFNRTPRGMTVTEAGEDFLNGAKKILREIDEFEDVYGGGKTKKAVFAASVPRASYISAAFSEFANEVDDESRSELFYKETNSSRTITNLLHADYNIGIIRYAENYDKYFKEMLTEKGLTFDLITEFRYVICMSENHPLADKPNITFDDLAPFTEIAHADPYVPSISMAVVRKEELPDNVKHRIFVFERASQFDLLEKVRGTFMWVSPLPDELCKKYGLIQRPCEDNKKIYRDVLIHKKDYKLTELDKKFVEKVCKAKRKYI